jgi:hypothetical protein
VWIPSSSFSTGLFNENLIFGFSCVVLGNHTIFAFHCRLSTLLKEIMAEKENKSIVFIETKRRVDEITRKMRRDG